MPEPAWSGSIRSGEVCWTSPSGFQGIQTHHRFSLHTHKTFLMKPLVIPSTSQRVPSPPSVLGLPACTRICQAICNAISHIGPSDHVSSGGAVVAFFFCVTVHMCPSSVASTLSLAVNLSSISPLTYCETTVSSTLSSELRVPCSTHEFSQNRASMAPCTSAVFVVRGFCGTGVELLPFSDSHWTTSLDHWLVPTAKTFRRGFEPHPLHFCVLASSRDEPSV